MSLGNGGILNPSGGLLHEDSGRQLELGFLEMAMPVKVVRRGGVWERVAGVLEEILQQGGLLEGMWWSSSVPVVRDPSAGLEEKVFGEAVCLAECNIQ